MNFKVRLKNKTWLLTFIAAVCAFLYEVLSLFGIIPKIPEESVINAAKTVIEALALLGVVTDPTTKGIKDSQRAMGYISPGGDEK